jgi:hypothetical protein
VGGTFKFGILELLLVAGAHYYPVLCQFLADAQSAKFGRAGVDATLHKAFVTEIVVVL